MTTSWELMTHLWRTSIGPWMTTGTQSPSHQSSLRVTCRISCFLQIERSSGGSGLKQPAHAEPAVRRDLRGSRTFGQGEIKRHRQGLKVDELSSTDVVDVTVFNLGNLACQSVQRQAEPRTLRLIMNQTSHIMMLVEGTSLSVNQWDEKLRAANWTLSSSDDHHHWIGVRTASSGTSVTPLVDNCGSLHQKIWYAVFDIKLGSTSDGKPVWKGGQNCLPSYGCPHQPLSCSNSLPVLQNQLCRSCWYCVPTFKLT